MIFQHKLYHLMKHSKLHQSNALHKIIHKKVHSDQINSALVLAYEYIMIQIAR